MPESQTHMCPACAAGLLEECLNPEILNEDGETWIIPCAVEFTQLISIGGPKEKGDPGRPTLGPGEVTDPKSTGRKRAAMLAPILTGQVCAWAGLRHAGGGVVPILGCNGHALIENKGGDSKQGLWQGDRHHGPDKNTLNNSVGMNLHSICVDCVTSDMRLLTEDLHWVRADAIQAGDRLIGFSEELKYSVFEPAVVMSVKKVREPSYRIFMKNGDVLTSSHSHQWVASRPSDGHINWFRTEQFMNRYQTTRNGHFSLRKFVEPWETDRSFEAGWLAGFLDGEGALSGDHLAVSQTLSGDNEIAAHEMERNLYGRVKGSINRQVRSNGGSWKDALVLRVVNLSDIMTVLGQVRPERLLAKWAKFLYEGNASRNKGRKHMKRGRSPFQKKDIKQEIDHIEYIGEADVYSIETTSHTLIVEGYLSHNCHHRWHSLNDPYYDESGRPGAEYPFIPVEPYYLHDPITKFTEDEFDLVEAWWDLPVKDRGDYPITPSDQARRILPSDQDSDTLDPSENPFPDVPFSEIGDSL